MRGLMAGAWNAEFYEIQTGAYVFGTNTLTTSSIGMTATVEEARAGYGNFLLGKYFHSSGLTLSLTDQEYDFEYLAMNAGGAIEGNAEVFKYEKAIVTTGGVVTVAKTPEEFSKNVGVVGWYKLPKETNKDYKVFKFDKDAKTAKLPSSIAVGTEVCIKYLSKNANARKFKVNTAFIPDIYHVVLTNNILASGSSEVKGASLIGRITLDIPMFQLDGTQNIESTPTGFGTFALTGSALAVEEGSAQCESGYTGAKYYSTWTEEIFNVGELDDVNEIVISPSNIEIAVGENNQLRVLKLKGGTSSLVLDNSLLTFSSSDDSVATVSGEGVLTAKVAGDATIEVIVTDNTDVSAIAKVTVVSA